MRLIPLKVLTDAEACPKHMKIVRREWPRGIPVTKQAALRALELGLPVDWLAYTVFESLLLGLTDELIIERQSRLKALSTILANDQISYDDAKKRAVEIHADYYRKVALGMWEILRKAKSI